MINCLSDDMKKKVLFVNSSLTSGGSERVMTLLANEFAKRGIDTSMVLLREKKPDAYEINKSVNLVRFTYGTKNKGIIAIKRITKLRKLVIAGNYDVVISFMYDINLTVLVALNGLNIPVIVSERADPNARKQTWVYRKIEHHYYLKANRIVLQTQQVMKCFGSDLQKKCIVIPNPVNIDLPVSDIKNRKKIIIAAGRMKEEKNFKLLINAFNRIHEEFNDFRLVIYGEGALRGSLEQQVKELQLSECVDMPGFTNQLASKMETAYVYVSSSDFEGISNSMIEAMAIGLPCVCTDCPVGGAAMMIEDGVNGLLTQVGNEDDLYYALVKVISDNKLAEKYGSNAQAIRNKYSIEKIASAWLEII